MTLILTIIAVVVIFSILVLIHEFGHFWAAKRAGVKVLEFGIGFPPRLFAKKYGETVYSVNAIPFGGFVRLFGEDARDREALKNKRSFAFQTPWTRTKIIVSGVLMNFLLAYVLLAVGFSFGIQPLILNENDLFEHIQSGIVETQPGIFVKNVKKGSAAEKAGIQKDDEIVALNGFLIGNQRVVTQLEKGQFSQDIDLTVRRSGAFQDIHFVRPEKGKDFGLEFSTAVNFPRSVVASVKSKSVLEKAGLLPHDAVLQVNGVDVYTPSDVLALLAQKNRGAIDVRRGTDTLKFPFEFSRVPQVVISEVLPKSAAAKAGFQNGDMILEIDGQSLESPEEVQNLIRSSEKKPVRYKILRGDKTLTLKAATDERNILGVTLTALTFPRGDELSLYQGTFLTSLTKIHDVKYSFGKSLSTAWDEMVRLTKVTVFAFGRTLKGLVKLEVPEDIGGPVQIAYYTHTFVQEGFFALLRFTALLSLSLAVINIIPFPALDGGRFFFIVLEVIFRRRLNARFESVVHTLGFALLMLLIILVTFSDFAKIFS